VEDASLEFRKSEHADGVSVIGHWHVPELELELGPGPVIEHNGLGVVVVVVDDEDAGAIVRV
jgi:hypothetical protein